MERGREWEALDRGRGADRTPRRGRTPDRRRGGSGEPDRSGMLSVGMTEWQQRARGGRRLPTTWVAMGADEMRQIREFRGMLRGERK